MTRLHIDSAFDDDLERIRDLMLGMGGRVEEAITLGARALEERDEDLAQQVVEGDHAIDALEEEIDQHVVRLLALRQPQAGDLRAVIAVMKMAADIERLGDYAKNMAKRVPVLSSAPQIEGAGAAIRRQARQVGQMLKDMLDAFARLDTALAEDVIHRDIEVDHMTNALFREFITHMMEDPRNISACLHYTFIAKNVERMGDLVTGGAEQVIFLATGERFGDRPKGESTATIDVQPD
ncbi:phosphate signaling complex protein PhoU [Pararhodobacter aggregans]|uniref:Phosphate-specific transport system accessory protein PhoU n=1 Tax=Pararhodobacter aggregans TaxID=404875 RepID=A0A2T7UPB5_9RHOB|nr:phosphate signaling complex protein PhoU [Pararhodobacter aggregans]PTX01141.1 PhoU-like phosphate uptake regulator [Pararhodobacter aggregans]PVE46532.1 phosphate transport system regulatory protein PhoU [Pararhodobacter aggregans]